MKTQNAMIENNLGNVSSGFEMLLQEVDVQIDVSGASDRVCS